MGGLEESEDDPEVDNVGADGAEVLDSHDNIDEDNGSLFEIPRIRVSVFREPPPTPYTDMPK